MACGFLGWFVFLFCKSFSEWHINLRNPTPYDMALLSVLLFFCTFLFADMRGILRDLAAARFPWRSLLTGAALLVLHGGDPRNSLVPIDVPALLFSIAVTAAIFGTGFGGLLLWDIWREASPQKRRTKSKGAFTYEEPAVVDEEKQARLMKRARWSVRLMPIGIAALVGFCFYLIVFPPPHPPRPLWVDFSAFAAFGGIVLWLASTYLDEKHLLRTGREQISVGQTVGLFLSVAGFVGLMFFDPKPSPVSWIYLLFGCFYVLNNLSKHTAAYKNQKRRAIQNAPETRPH